MNIWSNIKLTAAQATADYAGAWAIGLPDRLGRVLSGNKSVVKYYAPTTYKSVVLERIRHSVIQEAYHAVDVLNARYKKWLRGVKGADTTGDQMKENVRWLVEDSRLTEEGWEYGRIPLADSGGQYGYARDLAGDIVKESLMVYYDEEESHEVRENYYGRVDGSAELVNVAPKTYSTKTVWFADVMPQVSVSSGKNIVMSKVTGRDYTRKEIVSGDDLTFSVSGSLMCHTLPAVDPSTGRTVIKYPEGDVKKFIQVIQHPGIVNVNHFLFRQFNVDRVIIKDYSLENPVYQNQQPYRFTCVAVEPDEDVMLKTDTITTLDTTIASSGGDGVYNAILKKKWQQMAGDAAGDLAANTAKTLLGGLYDISSF